ncbi:MAG TPA: tetratricopeptide repeat protein, partial [Blastocatellia bacterium]|nr:tetratricopeptide repeat protein [Blastocatellia bacterium]
MSLDKAQALNAAKQYVLQRNVQAAVDIYQKVIKDDPSDLNVSSALGDLYVSSGQVQQAIAQLSRVASAYIEQGLARKAIATLKKMLAIDPANTGTAIKLADLYAQAGLPSEARQHYLQIADALYRKGSTLDALGVFRKLVQLDPSNTSTRIKLGELYLREGMNEQAYEAFMTAAELLTGKLEYKRALNAYNEALAIKPDSSDAQAAARRLMALLGVPDPEKSPRHPASPEPVPESSSRPAASSNPSIPGDRGPGSESFVVQEISKAEILVAYGKVNQAVSMLRQVLESNPDSIDVHIKLKDIYLRTGMMTEAAHECSALERIFEARGDSERARDYAIRASRLTQLLEQPSGDLPEPKRKPVEEVAPRLSPAKPESASEQQTSPKQWPIITTAPLTAPPRPDAAPKPRPVLSAPPLEPRPQPDTAPKPRPVLSSAPPKAAPQQDTAPKPRPVVSSAPPKAAPQPHIASPSHPIFKEAVASTVQPNLVTSSLAPPPPSPVTLPTTSDAGSPPGVFSQPAESPGLVADNTSTILPAQQSALEATHDAAVVRERSLPLLFAGSWDEVKRGRLTAAGIAAGVFVLLG